MRTFVMFVVLVVAVVPGALAHEESLDKDPTVVDADHYSVVFENEHVRVLEVSYPAGESSVMHSHPPLVAISLADGEFEMTTPDGESVSPPMMGAGDIIWDAATVHRPRNVGAAHARLYLVEMKELGTEEKNLELVKSGYEAFGLGDVEAVVALMHPEIEWTEAEGFPYEGTFVGPDAVVENVFARLGGEWHGWAADPHHFVADGDRVVAVGTYSGTHKETGKDFEAEFAHVFHIEDGKIVSFRQFVDSEPVLEAME
ncbi:MAG: nuclear transport factor 2 family protein [Thermoanaerobaculia bacterium]|nr:nuclear transport factor 2 family protein [Thermoanaerobaculia bacterium]